MAADGCIENKSQGSGFKSNHIRNSMKHDGLRHVTRKEAEMLPL